MPSKVFQLQVALESYQKLSLANATYCGGKNGVGGAVANETFCALSNSEFNQGFLMWFLSKLTTT